MTRIAFNPSSIRYHVFIENASSIDCRRIGLPADSQRAPSLGSAGSDAYPSSPSGTAGQYLRDLWNFGKSQAASSGPVLPALLCQHRAGRSLCILTRVGGSLLQADSQGTIPVPPHPVWPRPVARWWGLIPDGLLNRQNSNELSRSFFDLGRGFGHIPAGDQRQ